MMFKINDVTIMLEPNGTPIWKAGQAGVMSFGKTPMSVYLCYQYERLHQEEDDLEFVEATPSTRLAKTRIRTQKRWLQSLYDEYNFSRHFMLTQRESGVAA